MRAILEGHEASERQAHLSNEAAPIRFAKNAVRNSPWLVIAFTVHAVGIAVRSVIYVTRDARKEDDAKFSTVLREARVEEPEPELVLPKPPERDPVRAPSEDPNRAVAPEQEIIDPLADPGIRSV